MKTISKKMFVEAIEALKEQIDHDAKVSTAFQELFIDAGNMMPDNERLIFQLVRLLNEGMNDTTPDAVGNTFVSWFVYETDFGRKDNIIKLNGKTYKITTAAQLYDTILEYQKLKTA